MEEIMKRVGNGRLLLEVNNKIYDRRAIISTSYKFTDRAYIHINPISENVIGVYFKAKEDSNELLDGIGDRFCNELIDQQLRLDVETSYGNIRDLIVKHAFSPIENLEGEVKSHSF